MAYEKTNWEGRVVERPRTFNMKQNDDGTVTLIPAEGKVYNKGTVFSPENMNKIENGIEKMGNIIVPAGTVIWVARLTVPAGFLRCNGATISRTVYSRLFNEIGTVYGAGDGRTTFEIPDLRGQFIRGLDDGKGLDMNRTLGTFQADSFKGHTHGIPYGSNKGRVCMNIPDGCSDVYAIGEGKLTSETGGNETRPKNIALVACIKY